MTVDYGRTLGGLRGSVVDGGPGRDSIDVAAGYAAKVPGRTMIDETKGTISYRNAGTTTSATIAHFEEFYLSVPTLWTFTGTAVSEEVELDGTRRIHASMGAGDDRVFGSAGSDWVDGGPGTDSVYGYAGDDACVATEHRHSCHR